MVEILLNEEGQRGLKNIIFEKILSNKKYMPDDDSNEAPVTRDVLNTINFFELFILLLDQSEFQFPNRAYGTNYKYNFPTTLPSGFYEKGDDTGKCRRDLDSILNVKIQGSVDDAVFTKMCSWMERKLKKHDVVSLPGHEVSLDKVHKKDKIPENLYPDGETESLRAEFLKGMGADPNITEEPFLKLFQRVIKLAGVANDKFELSKTPEGKSITTEIVKVFRSAAGESDNANLLGRKIAGALKVRKSGTLGSSREHKAPTLIPRDVFIIGYYLRNSGRLDIEDLGLKLLDKSEIPDEYKAKPDCEVVGGERVDVLMPQNTREIQG